MHCLSTYTRAKVCKLILLVQPSSATASVLCDSLAKLVYQVAIFSGISHVACCTSWQDLVAVRIFALDHTYQSA